MAFGMGRLRPKKPKATVRTGAHGVDYEVLLRKYIAHVQDEEGTDFIDRQTLGRSASGLEFSEDEIAELQRLSKIAEGR